MTFPVDAVPSPCFVLDRSLLKRNLDLLADVQTRSGGRIIAALKGFAMWSVFPQLAETLHGTTASSLNEARLGREEFGREVHVYAVAYTQPELDLLATFAHHITFNSLTQWRRLKRPPGGGRKTDRDDGTRGESGGHACSYGLRINPEYSEVATPLYNPCRPGTRFGVTAADFANACDNGLNRSEIDGFHFHSLCEQGSETLQRTLAVIEQNFGRWMHGLKWINLGGGHHITADGYDVDLLVDEIRRLRDTYGVEVYLEPGEAIALNAGFLVCTVLDVFDSGDRKIAILDTSATAHMPDVLEMPYRPHVIDSAPPVQKPHSYQLGGLTCLAGDVIGDYAFDVPLQIGQRLVFTDMAHYSMVKTNMFNGVAHPAIALWDPSARQMQVVRRFEYEDFKNRLS